MFQPGQVPQEHVPTTPSSTTLDANSLLEGLPSPQAPSLGSRPRPTSAPSSGPGQSWLGDQSGGEHVDSSGPSDALSLALELGVKDVCLVFLLFPWRTAGVEGSWGPARRGQGQGGLLSSLLTALAETLCSWHKVDTLPWPQSHRALQLASGLASHSPPTPGQGGPSLWAAARGPSRKLVQEAGCRVSEGFGLLLDMLCCLPNAMPWGQHQIR